MRILHAVLGLFAVGLTVAACTINQNDWKKNPELDKYTRYGGGGGGTGGSMCTTLADCPAPANKCKERTCEGGVCGTKDKDCGALTCDAVSGQCTGCDNNDPQKGCKPKDCYDVVCENGKCEETLNGALTCNNDNGTCDDAGNCGKCDDGVKNGDETGVDCGDDTPCGACEGDPCSEASECKSGICADGVCCDMACDGLCQACDQPGKVGECLPLPVGTADDVGNKACGMQEGGCGETLGYCRCDDGVKNVDETDVDCGGPTCTRRCGTGHQCTDVGGSDCISTHCVDGYCCETTCAGLCSACDLPERRGLCLPLAPGATDNACPGGEYCGTGDDCDLPNDGSCSNNSACISNYCKNGQCASCQANADCGGGPNDVCINGSCFVKADQGQTCLAGEGCKSGYCVDGVCCDTPCDGLCMGCHLKYTGQPIGTCAPMLAGYDPHSECPQSDPPDPNAPGPGGSAYCSGADAVNGNSSCAQPQP